MSIIISSVHFEIEISDQMSSPQSSLYKSLNNQEVKLQLCEALGSTDTIQKYTSDGQL